MNRSRFMGNIIYLRGYMDKEVIYMDTKRKQEIEKIAESVVATLDLSESPYIDISTIIKKDNFDIQTITMPIETTGCLFVNNSENKDERERLIVVNKEFKNPDNEDDVVFKKSRFIAAHEYGHFKLHMPENKPLYAHRDSDKRDLDIEKEADYFARCVLMPKKHFIPLCDLLNDFGGNDRKFTVSILSKIFKVTRNKVQTRMEDLTEYIR